LNDHADAAYRGATGLEITFDDANAAYGVAEGAVGSRNNGSIFSMFNSNTVAIEAGKCIDIMWSGVNAEWVVSYYANDTIKIRAKNDSATWDESAATAALGTGWHDLKLVFFGSTGGDTGRMFLFVDDVLATSLTGLDNDASRWSYARVGMVNTNSTTFGGSYYLDLTTVGERVSPSLSELAAQSGTYGVSCFSDSYCIFTGPSAETAITAECIFDVNSLDMATNNMFRIISDVNSDLSVYCKYFNDKYNVYIWSENYMENWSESSYVEITDAPHKFRLVWQASSGSENDDGWANLYIDDVLEASITDMPNDTKVIDGLRFGPSLASGYFYGVTYYDDCKWADTTYDIDAEPSTILMILGFNF